MQPYQQAILARDTIDMIREYADNPDVLEYIETFTTSLAQILGDNSTVAWLDLAGVCDQRYYSLRQGNPITLNTTVLDAHYTAVLDYIEANRPA